MRFIFIYIICILPSFGKTLSWDIVSADELALRQIITSFEQMVPSDFYHGLKNKHLKLEVRKLSTKNFANPNEYFCPETNMKSIVYGKVNTLRSTITFDENLIQFFQLSLKNKIEDKVECKQKSIQLIAVATLLHEIAHLVDTNRQYSKSLDFKTLIGGKNATLSLKAKGLGKILNQNHDLSPDTYEYKNLPEAFAVNLEYYFLDKDYRCRRPSLTKYYDSLFNLQKFSSKTCNINYSVLLHSNVLDENLLNQIQLNPDKIYEIHYLWAAEGKAMMSRWGHSMFRVIMCAPWRKEVSEKCLDDVLYHPVISYRAQFHSIDTNLSQGLIGKLPSQQFIYRLSDILQEYNAVELRDLYSVPLKLSPSEKEDFIYLALERYWTYKSKYYFFTNNCGTETLNHLKAITPLTHGLKSTTPRLIFRKLVDNHDISFSQFLNLSENELIEKSYKFLSNAKRLEEHYQQLSSLNIYTEKNFSKFSKKTNHSQRIEVFKNIPEDKLNFSTLTSLIVLENHFREKYLQNIPALLQKKILRNKKNKSLIKDLDLNQSFSPLFFSPWTLFKSEYGMPLKDEYLDQLSIALQLNQDGIKGLNKTMQDLLNRYKETFLKEEFKKLSEMESHLAELKSKRNKVFVFTP